MIIKSEEQLNKVREAALITTKMLKELGEMLKPGIYPSELEKRFWEMCEEEGVKPSFYGVKGTHNDYGYSCCISVNDEILHGIPDSSRALEEGDVVKIDLGIVRDGIYTDQCFTFGIGKLSKEDMRLVSTARLATETAMKKAVAGTPAGDLGFTMESISRMAGFDTLKEFVGHGIGGGLHEPPEIPAFGPAGYGDILKEGMVICVECQVVAGEPKIYTSDDHWTIKTKDGSRGAMIEYMVIVGKDKPEVLTPMQDWGIVV